EQHKFEIADLLAGMVDAMTHTEEERVGHVQCPRCGLQYSSFKQTGRLGCTERYTAFQFQLRPLLLRIHGATRHRGKAPARGAASAGAWGLQRWHDAVRRGSNCEDLAKWSAIAGASRRPESARRASWAG